MPDTFFRNERFGRMHNVLVPNLYVRIYADGTVLFRLMLIVSLFCYNFFCCLTLLVLTCTFVPSIRVSLTLSCPMNLKLYPLDRQTCPMQIASCEYSHQL